MDPRLVERREGTGAPVEPPSAGGNDTPRVSCALLDENVEIADTNAEADCVAITCMTASAPRAYEIADAFTRRGISVVIGGIHPTVMPDEAAAHADAVVVGEAEPVWREMRDLAGCRLKPRYGDSGFACMEGMPIPRRSVLGADPVPGHRGAPADGAGGEDCRQ